MTLLLAGGLLVCAVAPQAAARGPIADASVVGAGRVAIGSLPSTVAINFNGRLCTGSVISPTAILTAAHCAALAPPAATSVRVNSASAYSGGQVIGVAAAFPDPGYSGRIVHDIAVLKLATPTTAPAIPMAIASENASLTGIGAPLTAAGFGQSEPTKFRKRKLGSLRAATLFARADCSSYGVFNPYIMVCASGRAFAKATVKFPSGKHMSRGVQRATCFGDSGGPLISNTTTVHGWLGSRPSGPGTRSGSPGSHAVSRGIRTFTRASPPICFSSSSTSDGDRRARRRPSGGQVACGAVGVAAGLEE